MAEGSGSCVVTVPPCPPSSGARYVKFYDSKGMYRGRWAAVSPHNRPSNTEDTELLGLNMDRNGQLLVGQVRTSSKYISRHNQDGSAVHSISVPLSPEHLASTSENTIVISSSTEKAVMIVDNEGQVLHRCNAEKTLSFWNPRGVCYHNNIIFVCNFLDASHEVSCFSLSAKYLGAIIVSNRPRCVTCTPEGGKLYISYARGVDIYEPK